MRRLARHKDSRARCGRWTQQACSRAPCRRRAASKWNEIEHRLFAFITMNWRGKPLLPSGHRPTDRSAHDGNRLKLCCEIDANMYPKGVKVRSPTLRCRPSTLRGTNSMASGTTPYRQINNHHDAFISRQAISGGKHLVGSAAGAAFADGGVTGMRREGWCPDGRRRWR
jgi:Rhodopirellula transposase DDE domain